MLVIGVFIATNPLVYGWVGCPCDDHGGTVSQCCSGGDKAAQDCCLDAHIPLPDVQFATVTLFKLPVFIQSLDYRVAFTGDAQPALVQKDPAPPGVSAAMRRATLQTWRL